MICHAPLIFSIAGTLQGRLSWRPLFSSICDKVVEEVVFHPMHVCFGSKADMCSAQADVRFPGTQERIIRRQLFLLCLSSARRRLSIARVVGSISVFTSTLSLSIFAWMILRKSNSPIPATAYLQAASLWRSSRGKCRVTDTSIRTTSQALCLYLAGTIGPARYCLHSVLLAPLVRKLEGWNDDIGNRSSRANSHIDLFDDKRRYVRRRSHFCSDGARAERERWLLDFGSRRGKPDFGGAVRMVGRSAAPRPLLAAETVGKAFNAG
jgi:hypothetical protein